jgi:hypothetical protein
MRLQVQLQCTTNCWCCMRPACCCWSYCYPLHLNCFLTSALLLILLHARLFPLPCRGLDCPSFEVVETRGSLQLRRYKAACFIVTRVQADNLLQAQVIASKVCTVHVDVLFQFVYSAS